MCFNGAAISTTPIASSALEEGNMVPAISKRNVSLVVALSFVSVAGCSDADAPTSPPGGGQSDEDTSARAVSRERGTVS